ncbi:MAG: ribbon-helix-helix protein, CopG family [Acidimicrobiales bacterium]
MATNLRLDREAEHALRAEAARTGRSQQELIRAAVDSYLGIGGTDGPRSEAEAMIEARTVLPARTPLRSGQAMIHLPPGVTTLTLLDRDERL